jgi:hypothetical protein
MHVVPQLRSSHGSLTASFLKLNITQNDDDGCCKRGEEERVKAQWLMGLLCNTIIYYYFGASIYLGSESSSIGRNLLTLKATNMTHVQMSL